MLQTFTSWRGEFSGYDSSQPEYARMVPIKRGTIITEDMYFDWVDDRNVRLKAKHGSIGDTWPSSPSQSQYYTLQQFTNKGNLLL